MKHTPGPWKVSFTKTGDAIFAQDKPICFAPAAGYVPNFIVGRDEVQANMHLVAAVPELLEACKIAIDALGCDRTRQGRLEAQEIIGAAIAKAKGERRKGENV